MRNSAFSSRITHHASRITHHSPLITHHSSLIMLATEATIYTIGGAGGGGRGFSLPRRADGELLALCRAGTFAYVLAPRQVGKSSLMIHTAERLAAEGIYTATVDLTRI